MQRAGFHHANQLAAQLQDDLDCRSVKMLQLLQTAMDTQSIAPADTPSTISKTTASTDHRANVVSGINNNNNIQVQMLRLLQKMQQDMRYSNNNNNNNRRNDNNDNNNNNDNDNNNNNTNTNNNNTRQRQNWKTADNTNFFRRITETYCWTHGGCNHKLQECDRRAPGHKPQATFTNKMGGSKAFCSPE